MIFDWDEEKSERNRRTRGFGFDRAARIFLGPVVEWVDDLLDYGEMRVIAIGGADGFVYFVVYTDRDDVRRIISARKATRGERELWLSFVSP